jgi:hypothetical protein
MAEMNKPGFLLAFVFILIFTAWPMSAQAQDPLCDVALYDQMVERARLQGQRETMTVENLVYKPDSILEYTCYPRFVDHIPPNIRYTSIFFESSGGAITYTVTNDFPSDPMFDLSRVPAENWMFSNFGHTFLGGRVPLGAAAAIPPAGNYVCDVMSAIWELARCQQFAPEEPQDGFNSMLTSMFTGEFRRYPTLCNAPYALSMGNVPVMPAAPVFTSAAVLPTDCGVPVPTGQVITMPLDQKEIAPGRPVTYNEKMCPNPTCTYIPTAPGPDSGNCVP